MTGLQTMTETEEESVPTEVYETEYVEKKSSFEQLFRDLVIHDLGSRIEDWALSDFEFLETIGKG